jgi:hypothetical protein
LLFQDLDMENRCPHYLHPYTWKSPNSNKNEIKLDTGLEECYDFALRMNKTDKNAQ